jgi:hypothetical protein
MIPLPDQHELISFFDTEPLLSFSNETWDYNHLTFVVVRGRERLVCEMQPAELVLRMTWHDGEKEMLNVNLESADGLKLDNFNGREQMRVTFSDGVGQLILQLRPVIHVFIEIKLP